jgi:hypothetical protein
VAARLMLPSCVAQGDAQHLGLVGYGQRHTDSCADHHAARPSCSRHALAARRLLGDAAQDAASAALGVVGSVAERSIKQRAAAALGVF